MVAEQVFFPISELSSYQSKWTIRARVTDKAPVRTFRKGNGEGKVFHVGLLDADGGEIRASFFNEAVDTFFDKLQKGKCYTLSNGSVRIANRQFNQCNHRYELAFDKIGRIEECQDVAQIESFVLKLVDLRAVQSRPLPFFVDLCGVITSAAPLLSFTSRDGKELVKRELTIADSTATSMDITLWGDRAKKEDKAFEGNPVVVLKGVNVKEWNGGRSGSLLQSGHLLFDHAIPEVQQMKEICCVGGPWSKPSVHHPATLQSCGEDNCAWTARPACFRHHNVSHWFGIGTCRLPSK